MSKRKKIRSPILTSLITPRIMNSILIKNVLPYMKSESDYLNIITLSKEHYKCFISEKDAFYPFYINWKGFNGQYNVNKIRNISINLTEEELVQFDHINKMHLYVNHDKCMSNLSTAYYMPNLVYLSLVNVSCKIIAPKLNNMFIRLIDTPISFNATIYDILRFSCDHNKNLKHLTIFTKTEEYYLSYILIEIINNSNINKITLQGNLVPGDYNRKNVKRMLSVVNYVELSIPLSITLHALPSKSVVIVGNSTTNLILHEKTKSLFMIDDSICDNVCGDIELLYYKRTKKISMREAFRVSLMIGNIKTLKYLYLDIPDTKIGIPLNLKHLRLIVSNTASTPVYRRVICKCRKHFINKKQMLPKQFAQLCKNIGPCGK